MKTRRSFIAGTAILALAVSMGAQSAWWPFSSDSDESELGANVTEIGWEDLIPSDFQQPENPYITMSQEEIDKLLDGSEESNAKRAMLEAEFNFAPVVPELDGKRVRLPAYITPLEFQGESLIKEFLLVPYVGACMHVPPPPSNQIVHVQSPEAVEFRGMYEPVWATGVIRTETVKSDLAESGYRLDVEHLEPYTLP